MAEHGSPDTGESTEYNEVHDGRRCRVAARVWERHTPNSMGRTWSPHEHFAKVYEYEPKPEPEPEPEPEREFTPEQVDQLPEWMRQAVELPRGDGTSEPPFGPVPEPNAPASRLRADKFAYHKALRGRFGKGRELTETEYIVLSMLWDYADGALSNARPGNTRLAQDLGYTGSHAARTAGAHVKSLERKRFVVCTRRSGGRGSAATYRLTLPEWESSRLPEKGGAVPPFG